MRVAEGALLTAQQRIRDDRARHSAPVAMARPSFDHRAVTVPACPTIPLPNHWPACVKQALLHVIACARLALLDVVTGFENSPSPFARYTAEVTRLRELLAQREEELRILRARLACIPPLNRPHYPPPERLAILALRAATGWNIAETARRFLVTSKTLREWIRRLAEQGADALVHLPEPVDRFPDYVTVVVQQLRATVPHMGKERIANAEPTTGSEDFSEYLKHAPGAMLFLGSRTPHAKKRTPAHSPGFDIDERCLPLGVEIMTRICRDYLGQSVGAP